MSWTGNRGQGTAGYTAYSRDHLIRVAGKPDIAATSDTAFRGSPGRYNPEELFVAALSSCHMLWYLHLCAVNDIVVTDYQDEALGTMVETDDGGGYFKEVTLLPDCNDRRCCAHSARDGAAPGSSKEMFYCQLLQFSRPA